MNKRESIKNLFLYIQEQLKQRNAYSGINYEEILTACKINSDCKKYIILNHDLNSKNSSNFLLEIKSPILTPCPEPQDLFIDWIDSNYSDKNLDIIEPLEIPRNSENYIENDESLESFDSNAKRVTAFEKWLSKRNEWLVSIRIFSEVKTYIEKFVSLHDAILREEDPIELVLANYFFYSADDVKHNSRTYKKKAEPLVYIKLNIDVENQSIKIVDAEDNPILDNNKLLEHFNIGTNNLDELGIHPLNNEIEKLIVSDKFRSDATLKYVDLTKGEDIPKDWYKNYNYLIVNNPQYAKAYRKNKTLNSIKEILDDLEKEKDIPTYFNHILDYHNYDYSDDFVEQDFETKLSLAAGIDNDIYLSMEANTEQIEIARKIGKFNGVVVQGPPGTGKTHTIANLLGHFLAQGKKVLVTSEKAKALTVLKDKIPDELKSLCVSMLERKDLDNCIGNISYKITSEDKSRLQREIENIKKERNKIIQDLKDTWKTIHKYKKDGQSKFKYLGKEYTPEEMAKFVNKYNEQFSYIPSPIKTKDPIPLNDKELVTLFKSNDQISEKEENYLASNPIDPTSLKSIHEFSDYITNVEVGNKKIYEICSNHEWKILDISDKIVIYNQDQNKIEFKVAYLENIIDLFSASIDKLNKHPLDFDEWMLFCLDDYVANNKYTKLWDELIKKIEDFLKIESHIFDKEYRYKIKTNPPLSNMADYRKKELINDYCKLANEYNKKPSLFAIFKGRLKHACKAVSINDKNPNSREEFEYIYNYLLKDEKISEINLVWEQLFNRNNVNSIELPDSESFSELHELIRECKENKRNLFNNIDDILTKTEDSEYFFMANDKLEELLGSQGDQYTKGIRKVKRTSRFYQGLSMSIRETLPDLLEIFKLVQVNNDWISKFEIYKQDIISRLQEKFSLELQELLQSIENKDIESYTKHYTLISTLWEKKNIQEQRAIYLSILDPVAPNLKKYIEQRKGKFASSEVPSDLADAWKWSIFNNIINDKDSLSLQELIDKANDLSTRYRKITASLCENLAWFKVFERKDKNNQLASSLIAYQMLMKKIGKGTGKNANVHRKAARSHLANCKDAISAWIMPIDKALEVFVPGENKFDIVIIDEASQSDLSALPVLYMADKVIIVGDDKQIGPQGFQINAELNTKLKHKYLQPYIPNYELYDINTSIYDLGALRFPQLMLKEHFRCVPEIINYSNKYNYAGRILPLRPSNSELKPIVTYHVENGQEVEKVNDQEARTITALINACIQQKEYENKSIGVLIINSISEKSPQIARIESYIQNYISRMEINNRRILCGSPSNFQGDERDVIFISVVDSTKDDNSQLYKKTEGTNDTYKKALNVAMSRARDQIWLVHSLDPKNDLKDGDLRKDVFEYANNYQDIMNIQINTVNKAESIFEKEVAAALNAKGYDVTMQKRVGNFRLDMVVSDNSNGFSNEIAIECDGEEYHSGDENIADDMQRQIILERSGWNFIRIRGSEYFADPTKTIENLEKSLNSRNIYPQKQKVSRNNENIEDLLTRTIIAKAQSFMESQWPEPEAKVTNEFLAMALNNQPLTQESVMGD